MIQGYVYNAFVFKWPGFILWIEGSDKIIIIILLG